MNWQILKEFCEHLIFPESCPICGAPGKIICPECLSALLEKEGVPKPHWLTDGVPPSFYTPGGEYEVRTRTIYRGVARTLILAAKYGTCGRLAQILGKELATLVSDLGPGWVIVLVPPHRKIQMRPTGDRRLEWMAGGLSSHTGYPVREVLGWRYECGSQKGCIDHAARRKLPQDCFVCTGEVPEKVLLLDDVTTTGTTLLRCASCLYAAGARQVISLSWAQAHSTPQIRDRGLI